MEPERNETKSRQEPYFFNDPDSQALPVPRKLRKVGRIGERTVDSVSFKEMKDNLWAQVSSIRKEDKV
jgi:hypothetical protein